MVEPGGFNTEFGPNLFWAEGAADEKSPYRAQSNAFQGLMKRVMARSGAPAEHVVSKVASLTEKRHMPLRTRVGLDCHAAHWAKAVLPERIFSGMLSFVYGKVFGKNGKG